MAVYSTKVGKAADTIRPSPQAVWLLRTTLSPPLSIPPKSLPPGRMAGARGLAGRTPLPGGVAEQHARRARQSGAFLLPAAPADAQAAMRQPENRCKRPPRLQRQPAMKKTDANVCRAPARRLAPLPARRFATDSPLPMNSDSALYALRQRHRSLLRAASPLMAQLARPADRLWQRGAVDATPTAWCCTSWGRRRFWTMARLGLHLAPTGGKAAAR